MSFMRTGPERHADRVLHVFGESLRNTFKQMGITHLGRADDPRRWSVDDFLTDSGITQDPTPILPQVTDTALHIFHSTCRPLPFPDDTLAVGLRESFREMLWVNLLRVARAPNGTDFWSESDARGIFRAITGGEPPS